MYGFGERRRAGAALVGTDTDGPRAASVATGGNCNVEWARARVGQGWGRRSTGASAGTRVRRSRSMRRLTKLVLRAAALRNSTDSTAPLS